MNINEIKLNNEGIIYTINDKDFTIKLPTKVIDFINKYHIGLYDLVTTESVENFNENYYNSIETKYIGIKCNNKDNKEYKFYSHTLFKFDEYEFRNRIVNILKEKNPALNIYYFLLNDFPSYGYIEYGYRIYGNFNKLNKINEYKGTSIIEDLETGKREFQQIDYYNPKNGFNFKYYINSKNEVKYSFDEMIEELKKEFNIS